MKQNKFETRQRTEELLAQALSIWQQSDKAEQLEGLQADPVFRMLLTVLAYQENEFDSEIEQAKVDILEEFQGLLSVGEAGKALPATIAIQTSVKPELSDTLLTSENTFYLSNPSDKEAVFPFIPILNTRVINASVSKVTRLDGRRWHVSLQMGNDVSELSGMTFSVANDNYYGLHVTMVDNGFELPLISPWEYANMPMSRAFSFDTLLYNSRMAVNVADIRSSMAPHAVYTGMDLFARQNIRLYVVDKMPKIESRPTLDLMFEFDSISDDFVFNAANFHINVVPLANAQIKSVDISSSKPVERLAGSGSAGKGQQFLHLLRPSDDQLFSTMPIQVRRVNADRFNRGRLAKLLHNLIARYSSDYYAFIETGNSVSDGIINSLRRGLLQLSSAVVEEGNHAFEGVYLMLPKRTSLSALEPTSDDIGVSLKVDYLVCHGSAVNALLNKQISFGLPSPLDPAQTAAVTSLQQAFDEVYDSKAAESAKRYLLSTDDRLVTAADMKIFCLNELMTRFGLVRSLITSIRISRELFNIGTYHTYQIVITVNIQDNVFTQRAFADKIAQVETYLSKMIQVRSTDLYPVKVILKLK